MKALITSGILRSCRSSLASVLASRFVTSALQARSLAARGPLHRGELPRMGPEVGLRADCNRCRSTGSAIATSMASPDFEPAARMQADNDSPKRRIVPKKSWETHSNRIGATPPRMPRTARSDFQPFLGIHLIDGDPETYWASRDQNQPDAEPAWARIDLAKETQVGTMVILPRDDNQGMPKRLTVRVSRDAWHWETVYDNPDQEDPKSAHDKYLLHQASHQASGVFGRTFALWAIVAIGQTGTAHIFIAG